ncbi:hypothetical protein V6N12_028993 [Hibiscus sabdariffa]|uniref:Uncharacterized protein n=1 Tax=Hibiscus sabdariffa TaxID=183260 RepID=A0ABR2F7F3_9ROSI
MACMCPRVLAWSLVGPWLRVQLYASNDALYFMAASSSCGRFGKIRVPFPDARHALALSLHRLVAGNSARHLPIVEVFLRTVRRKPYAHARRVVTTHPSWPRFSVECKEFAPWTSCALLQDLCAPRTEGCTPWLPSMRCHGCVPISSYARGLIPTPRGQLAPSSGPLLPRQHARTLAAFRTHIAMCQEASVQNGAVSCYRYPLLLSSGVGCMSFVNSDGSMTWWLTVDLWKPVLLHGIALRRLRAEPANMSCRTSHPWSKTLRTLLLATASSATPASQNGAPATTALTSMSAHAPAEHVT